MASQCEYCIHNCFRRGIQRGIMDCDPDEYWCSADEDLYYNLDDEEIAIELAEEGENPDDVDIDCPSFMDK